MTTEPVERTVPTVEPEQLAQYEQRYGRKLTPVEATIVHKWNTAAAKPRSILAYPDMPQEKFDNALLSYAAAASGDLILGLQDTTLLGSGKEGVLFTTGGLFWKLSGTPSAMSVRFEELDPDVVTFKQSFASSTLVLTEKHRLSLPGSEDEPRLAVLTSFVRDAIAATPSKLPQTCWEFCSSVVEGKAKSVTKHRSLDEVKKALTSHAVQTNWLHRKYNPRLCVQGGNKGEWEPIPDDLYQQLGLSKQAVVKAEKRWNRNVLIVAGTVATLLVAGGSVGLWFLVGHTQGPQTPAAWGSLIGRTVGVIVGSVALFRVHPVLGVIAFIAGLAYVI